MKPGDLCFVYGSLKRGHFNNILLENAEYVGEGTLPFAVLYDLGAFPGLRLTENREDSVRGELFRIDSDDTSRSLDQLEGHPDFYRREVREVSVVNGDDISFHSAWVYVFQTDMSDYPDRVLKDGTWN